MPRKIAWETRCIGCGLRRDLCLCPEIPRLRIETRLLLLMHCAEVTSTTNTGRLAALAVPNSEVRLRGHILSRGFQQGLGLPTGRALFLFPSDEARVLTPEWVATLPRPLTLVVPDGTWRQASKVYRREPELSSVERVKLPSGPPTEYGLRRAPREGCLSTLEAVARALGILDGPEVQRQLEELFRQMVRSIRNARQTPPSGSSRNLRSPQLD